MFLSCRARWPGLRTVDVSPGKAAVFVANCEHVASMCAADRERLLEADPFLSVLFTSRTLLWLNGKQAYRPNPLALSPRTADAASAINSSLVELFVRRVTSADDHFALTETNVK